MKTKINIYTSFYSKMLNRHKFQNDFYVQISRSLFYPKKGIDGKSIMSMIDLNFGQSLGMYEQTLQEYEERIRSKDNEKDLQDLVEIFTPEYLFGDISKEEELEIENVIKELQEEKEKFLKNSYEQNLNNWKNQSNNIKEKFYYFGFTESYFSCLKNWNPLPTFNFFLLCFEDLKTKYTEKDEQKWIDCKAGTFKTCHRTVLAKVLNEYYNLCIAEW